MSQEPQIMVDASKILNKISPLICGLGIEELNHEVYGGLYDQKIFGESFEEPLADIEFKNFKRYEGYWSLNGKSLSVLSHPGAKLVSETTELNNGTI